MAKRAALEKLGQPDWILLGATAALCAIGLMMVYSASFDLSFREWEDPTHYLKAQLSWMGIGAVIILILSQLHYRHLTKVSIPLMLVTLGLLVTLAITRERQLLSSSVSLGELAKLTAVIYIGHWLASKRVEQLRRLPVGPLPFTIIVGILAGLVMIQPDLSEALVIVMIAFAMFFMAGADVLQFVIGGLGGGAAFGLVVSKMPYAMQRLEPHLQEWKNPLGGTNFQLQQGLIAMGSGGILGFGPGNGRAKYQWLPVPHTDSIFAILGEELGFIGCLAVLGLFVIIAVRGFQIASRARDPFGRMLAIGITTWITIQALFNVAVVTGTIPYTGIALPFVSYGGSSLVTCMTGIGIMISISRVTSGTELLGARPVTPTPPPASPEDWRGEQAPRPWAKKRENPDFGLGK